MTDCDRVPVLMYHRVDLPKRAEEAPLCVTPSQFSAHMTWLAEHGYRPCTIDAFARWVAGHEQLARGSVLITFDDGYAGLHTYALPCLAAKGWPAAVFLVSGLIGQRDNWAQQRSDASGMYPLLDRYQIAEMAGCGIAFHSHSRTHLDLTKMDDAVVADQVRGSRSELQDLTGTPVDHFAYPYGRFDERVQQAVLDAGYTLAFSVRSGFNRVGADRLSIRRLDITGYDTPRRFGRKVSMGTNDGSLRHQLRYLAGRLIPGS